MNTRPRLTTVGGLGAALLSVALSACGSGVSENKPLPVVPYNPNASASEQHDARVAYNGDWVLVAKLADGTTRYGVASVSVHASSSTLVNAGGGVAGWCSTATCTSNDESGVFLAGSYQGQSGPLLTAGMVPKNSTTPRFVMIDDDGIVDTVNGKPVIAGQGTWTLSNGTDAAAFIALIQTSSTPSVVAQAIQSQSLYSQSLQRAEAVFRQLSAGQGHRDELPNVQGFWQANQQRAE